MPEYYDIYGLSNERNTTVIEAFLDHFSIRSAIENRSGQDFGFYRNTERGTTESGTVSIETLTEVIDYGVKHPVDCFVFYINGFLKEAINDIILKFTNDRKIIFGVSIVDRKYVRDSYKDALAIANDIAIITKAIGTSIQYEMPPADDEAEFWINVDLWKDFNPKDL